MRTPARRRGWLLGVACAGVIWCAAALADDDGSALKDELDDDEVRSTWIYDDIEKGYAKAKETGKPLLVAFR